MPGEVSLAPSSFIEGSAIPQDLNLRVREARFVFFDYVGKANRTTAARLTLVSDEGQEYVQHYSAGDPTKFIPSSNGKTLENVGTMTGLVKSSNFAVLMGELVNAGYPENKLSSDISTLEGLYAYWIGIQEPERKGLRKADDRIIIIPVPSKIIELPWEMGKAKKTTKSKATENGDALSEAVTLIQTLLESDDTVTRQDLAAAVFSQLGDHPLRDEIAAKVFSPELMALATAKGIKVGSDSFSNT